MYKKFFGLQLDPFNVSPDPRFLFDTAETREAFACLTYGIQKRQGFVLLTGEVGTGKTTLLNKLLEWLSQEHVPTSFIFNPRLEPAEFFDFMMSDFGVKYDPSMKSKILLRLNDWLLERYRAGNTAVVVVDEAQNLSTEVLEEIRLLTNLETATQKLLQIVLCGQPELDEKLRQPELRQLWQRIRLRHRTQPLTLEQTQGYIDERLRIAGANGQSIFGSDAIESIHKYARGVPRVINLLCEHALISAYADQLRSVPAATIEELARHFALNVRESGVQFSPPQREDDGGRQADAVPTDAAGKLRFALSKSTAGRPNQFHKAQRKPGLLDSGAVPPNPIIPPGTNPRGLDTSRASAASESHLRAASKEPNADVAGSGLRPAETQGVEFSPRLSRGSVETGPEPASTTTDNRRAVWMVIGSVVVSAAVIVSWWMMQVQSHTAGVKGQPSVSSSHPSEARPEEKRGTATTAVAPSAQGELPASGATSNTPTPSASPLPRTAETESRPTLPDTSRTLPAPEGESMTGARAVPGEGVVHRPRPVSGHGLSAADAANLRDKLVVAAFLMDRNDYNAAIEAFNAALKIDPSSRQARAGLQRARQALEAQKTSTHP